MIESLFGVPILKTRLPDHDEIKQAFLSVLDNDEYFKQVPSWRSNCDSTYTKFRKEIPWGPFTKEATNLVNTYLAQFNPVRPLKYGIQVWLNRYEKGQYQEVHNHVMDKSVVSCAYMLELPPNSGNFTFFQEANDFWHGVGLSKICARPFPINSSYAPALTEGDVIFFPSYLCHYVTFNESELRRSTISANFCLT